MALALLCVQNMLDKVFYRLDVYQKEFPMLLHNFIEHVDVEVSLLIVPSFK
jgi:hypothetical protein